MGNHPGKSIKVKGGSGGTTPRSSPRASKSLKSFERKPSSLKNEKVVPQKAHLSKEEQEYYEKKREEKKAVKVVLDEEEEEEEVDELGDEQEFTANVVPSNENDMGFNSDDGDKVKLLKKQELISLQVEVLKGIQDLFNVALPIAAVLLHFHKWDKDRLIEKWIEDSENVCNTCGVFFPILSKNVPDTPLDKIFLPFREEEQPRRPSSPPKTNEEAAPVGTVRLLDLIRPFLRRRTHSSSNNDDELNFDIDPLLIVNVPSNLTLSSSSSSSRIRGGSRQLDSPVQTPPLPPSSSRLPPRFFAPIPPAEDLEIAAVQLSLISQVQELFPELDEEFVSSCLREYRNNYERVVDSILEGTLPKRLMKKLKVLRRESEEEEQESDLEDVRENRNGNGLHESEDPDGASTVHAERESPITVTENPPDMEIFNAPTTTYLSSDFDVSAEGSRKNEDFDQNSERFPTSEVFSEDEPSISEEVEEEQDLVFRRKRAKKEKENDDVFVHNTGEDTIFQGDESTSPKTKPTNTTSTAITTTTATTTTTAITMKVDGSKIIHEILDDLINEVVKKQVRSHSNEVMVSCPVCYEDFPSSEVYGLPCEHTYCLDCWRNYLTSKLSEGMQPSLVASCINPQCKLVIDISTWRKLLDETQFLRYQWFFLKSFVDNCSKAVWCSNPISCGYAAYFEGFDLPAVLEVRCHCGWKFCFHCGEEAHRPAGCKQVSDWQALRTGEEGQNALWLSQNTKRCPACKVHIEKNDGCMHMTCKNCDYEFCWLCKGPWAEHGDKTGGYYSCNRYDPLKHDTPDLDLRFGKYVHHFQRFQYHANARKVAETRRADIKMREPTLAPGDEPWGRAFLYEVLDLALTCRQILKYTYVYGFYLEGQEKALFEFLQEDLEKSTEHLSELLFREIDNIMSPIGNPADILHIKNYSKVTRKFLENLITGMQSGLVTDYPPPNTDVTPKKLKDKKKKKSKMNLNSPKGN